MDEWKKDARRDVVFVGIDALVPQDHLLRKIEKVMDYLGEVQRKMARKYKAVRAKPMSRD